MKTLLLALVLSFTLASALAWNLAGPDSNHDWTLNVPKTVHGIRDVYTYGVRQTEYRTSQTWVFYGPNFAVLPVPFWRFITGGLAATLVLSGVAWGALHNHRRHA